MPMGISTSLDANGLGGRPEKSHPPRGISPIFARLIKTQTIACGIGQPRLAPAPFFILRHLVEAHRAPRKIRSEEHTSELQSLMRISYAVFCLKKKNVVTYDTINTVKTTE